MRVTRDLDPAGGRRSGAEVLAHLSEDLVVFGRSESDRRGSGGIGRVGVGKACLDCLDVGVEGGRKVAKAVLGHAVDASWIPAAKERAVGSHS